MVDGPSDPFGEETCGIFHISTLPSLLLRLSPTSSLAPSPPPPLSPPRQPANYHLLSINQIRGVFNPLLQSFPGVRAVHTVEKKGLQKEWSSSPRKEASVGKQKSKGCKCSRNLQRGHFPFLLTINCLQWARSQTRRVTLLSRTGILLF